jgi:hypothetical protein
MWNQIRKLGKPKHSGNGREILGEAEFTKFDKKMNWAKVL